MDSDALAETELKFATKKPSFVVRTRLVSSIYTQDPALNEFFNRYDSGRDDKTLEEVRSSCVYMCMCCVLTKSC